MTRRIVLSLTLLAAFAAPAVHAQQPRVPAEKTSFAEVTSQLDAGGDCYVYLSTERFLGQAGQFIDTLRDLAATAAGPQEREKIDLVFAAIRRAVEESGITEVSGVGASSIALEPGLYRNRGVLHHYPNRKQGKLWSALGTAPHELDVLKLLPAGTALAFYTDLDSDQLFNWVADSIRNAKFPELQQNFDQGLKDLNQRGFDLPAICGSITGVSLVLSLDPNRTAVVPLPTGPLEVPAPELMVIFKVKNDKLFDTLEQQMATKAPTAIIREDVGGLKLRTMQVPKAIPVPLSPTYAAGNGYFILSSTRELIIEAMAVRDGAKPGLLASADYQRLAKGLPTLGNTFGYLHPRFTEVLRKAISQAGKQGPQEKAVIEKIMGLQGDAPFALGIYELTPTGWVGTSNSSISMSQALLIQLSVIPTAIAAGVMLPAVAKARVQAQRTVGMNNLKQIGIALQMHAADNGGKLPAEDGVVGLNVLLKNQYIAGGQLFLSPTAPNYTLAPAAPAGQAVQLAEKNCAYLYLGGLTQDDANGAALPIVLDKPRGAAVNIVFLDGHVETLQGVFRTCEEVANEWVRRAGPRLPKERADWLRAKAKALDLRRVEFAY